MLHEPCREPDRQIYILLYQISQAKVIEDQWELFCGGLGQSQVADCSEIVFVPKEEQTLYVVGGRIRRRYGQNLRGICLGGLKVFKLQIDKRPRYEIYERKL